MSIKTQKRTIPILSHLYRTGLVNKKLLHGIRTRASSYGTHQAIQSARYSPIVPAPIAAQDLSILPTRQASQLLNYFFLKDVYTFARVYDEHGIQLFCLYLVHFYNDKNNNFI